MPASSVPMASTTTMTPAGIASIAARVDLPEASAAGVARSSRAGRKRMVNARPTARACPGSSGLVPRSQTFRSPCFSRTMVIVAVLMAFKADRSLIIPAPCSD